MKLGVIDRATLEPKEENKHNFDFKLIFISMGVMFSITLIFSNNFFRYIAGLLGSLLFFLICIILYFSSFVFIMSCAISLSRKISCQKCHDWKVHFFLLTIITCGIFSFVISILNNSTSGLSYLHGFRDRLAKRIDLPAIRKWTQEIEISEEVTSSFVINLKDTPEFVRNLKPDYDCVSISIEHLDGQDIRIANFRWKFIGCLHLRVLPYGTKPLVISNREILEVAPGAYIRKLPK